MGVFSNDYLIRAVKRRWTCPITAQDSWRPCRRIFERLTQISHLITATYWYERRTGKPVVMPLLMFDFDDYSANYLLHGAATESRLGSTTRARRPRNSLDWTGAKCDGCRPAYEHPPDGEARGSEPACQELQARQRGVAPIVVRQSAVHDQRHRDSCSGRDAPARVQEVRTPRQARPDLRRRPRCPELRVEEARSESGHLPRPSQS